MKALKCKTLDAELAHAYALHFTLTTVYLILTLVGNGHFYLPHVEASMIENSRLGHAKVKNEL